MFHHILLPTDLSEHTARAADMARDLARGATARVTLLHVIETISGATYDEFATFYRDMFGHQVRGDGMSAIYTEYAWDMGWCDPCASSPLTPDELAELGVFWLDAAGRATAIAGGPIDVFVTRLHARYDRQHFPEDLAFQETGDRTNFQGRYILRHEWKGGEDCPAAKSYRAGLAERRAREARTLAALTGWDLERIRTKMALGTDWTGAEDRSTWWERLWKD